MAASDALASPAARWAALRRVARHRLDFAETLRLDKRLGALPSDLATAGPSALRLAVLGSYTLDHLLPGIRVGGLRRDLPLDVRIGAYDQYRQDLLGSESWLATFRPEAVLLALHADALLAPMALGADEAEIEAAGSAIVEAMRALWRAAKDRFKATVLQQTVLDVAEPLFGHFEAAVAATPSARIARLNAAIRRAAREDGVLLIDLDLLIARHGRKAWFDPALWASAKQEIRHGMTPLYGDHVARVLAASRGLAKKCLVLDLDNTLWGGLVGDDGVGGIKIGPGDPAGEAFLAFQTYCKRLGERGVVLAVCSKNDLADAEAPFRERAEMALKRDDFAAFVVNWDDKAANLRAIAETLNLGLDALVFFDDNPAERALIRRELPEIEVPEVPSEPALYPECLAAAGYFESVAFTEDDRKRAGHYAGNRQRATLEARATDIDGFLRDLDMELRVGPFDSAGLPRVVQLINKTNQFNLTTRRRSDAEIAGLIEDSTALTFQARLLDRFGDNGLISVAIALPDAARGGYALDTWLMSCRVLGRQVERALMGVVAAAVKARGQHRVWGVYRPSAKNAMVRQHYAGLGFVAAGREPDGAEVWRLDLDRPLSYDTPIRIVGGS
jgi:FkbH-like protein